MHRVTDCPFLPLETIVADELIPKGSQFYRSGFLNLESKTPYKIFILFLDREAHFGHPHVCFFILS
jgi:hypothetical protein